jgi:hypothetical protein
MYREISDQYFSVQTLHSVNKKLTLGSLLLKNGNKFAKKLEIGRVSREIDFPPVMVHCRKMLNIVPYRFCIPHGFMGQGACTVGALNESLKTS